MSTPKNPTKKPWFTMWWGLLIIGVIALIVFGVVYFSYLVVREIGALSDGEPPRFTQTFEASESTDSDNDNGVVQADVSIEGRPSQGNPDANVVIIEFGDFQCPFCKKEFPIVRKIMLEYQEDLLFVYRHYPLTSIHPEAQKAAEAAECAFEQGKFWEYHDMLYLNQERLDVPALKDYGLRLGLNTDQFNTCLDTGEKEAVVAQDVADGKAAGVTGTPTFFINGNRVTGALPEDFFKQAIEYFK